MDGLHCDLRVRTLTVAVGSNAGFDLRFVSDLASPPEEVWAHACTMAGVNAELGPWVRMTVPADARGVGLVDAPVGEVAFSSWLLAGGALPFDRHRLKLEEIGPGRRFLERSSSWLQAEWEHERRVEPAGTGCRVTDRLHVVPRLGLTSPLARRVVRALFEHRHRKLRERFGSLALAQLGREPPKRDSE